MRKDIRLCARIGIVHHSAFPRADTRPGDFLESIMSIVQDPFYNHIEIASIADAELRRQVKEALISGGLSAYFCAAPLAPGSGEGLAAGNEQGRRTALRLAMKAVDEANEMNARLLLLPRDYVPEEAIDDAAYAAFLHSLRDICRYAETNGGLRIAVEIPYSTRRKFPRRRTWMERLARSFDEERLGLFNDLSQIPAEYGAADRELQSIGSHLLYTRLGNCCLDGRYKRINGAVGCGSAAARTVPRAIHSREVKDHLQRLEDIGYFGERRKGAVSFNIQPMPGESSAAALANGKRTLLEAWRRLDADQIPWPNC